MTNQLFSITKVANIQGAVSLNNKKPFYGMEFAAGSKSMVLSYTEKFGAKLFWKIDGRIKETTKNEVLVWLKKFQGADAKKLAGYVKLLEPISRGAVVSQCSVCGRGIDQAVIDWCVKKHEGIHLCMSCQKGKGKKGASEASAKAGSRKAASVASGSLAGVPVFRVSELKESKPVKLDALYAQIIKKLPTVEGDVQDKLKRYAETIASIQATQGKATGEAIQEDRDQREQTVPVTDGVKEGSEPTISHPCAKGTYCDSREQVSQVGAYCLDCGHHAALYIEKQRQEDAEAMVTGNYESLKKTQLIAELVSRGIEKKTIARLRKAALVTMLVENDAARAEAEVAATTVLEDTEVIVVGDGVAPF